MVQPQVAGLNPPRSRGFSVRHLDVLLLSVWTLSRSSHNWGRIGVSKL